MIYHKLHQLITWVKNDVSQMTLFDLLSKKMTSHKLLSVSKFSFSSFINNIIMFTDPGVFNKSFNEK